MSTFSPGEKLIITMLSDMSKALKLDPSKFPSGINPEFVADAVEKGHEWSIGWKYDDLFEKNELEQPKELTEVVNILEMWGIIEASYQSLSDEDKERIADQVGAFGKHPTFDGFDDEQEHMHREIAFVLTNKLDRFPQFKDNALRSPVPRLEKYCRMFEVFKVIRHTVIDRTLTADELIQVLKA